MDEIDYIIMQSCMCFFANFKICCAFLKSWGGGGAKGGGGGGGSKDLANTQTFFELNPVCLFLVKKKF